MQTSVDWVEPEQESQLTALLNKNIRHNVQDYLNIRAPSFFFFKQQCINSKHTEHFTTVSWQNFVHQLNNLRTNCFSSFSPFWKQKGNASDDDAVAATGASILQEKSNTGEDKEASMVT